MTPADKAKAQMRSMGLSAPYIGSKETRTEEEIKQDQKTLAENVPILGEAMLAKEIGEDIKDENYLSAALNTLALGVGVVPGAGKVVSKPIRSAAKAVRKNIKVKSTSVSGPYYDAPNYGDYHSRAAKIDQKKGKEKLKKLKGTNADFDVIQETVSESRIGNTRGQTAQADKVSFNPTEIKNVQGLMGEELYRSGDYTPPGRSSKLELLKKNIKEKGYKPEPITIVVREDGTPFIAEGNHRLAEALESGRPKIDANIQYLRNAEKVDGPLNPKRLNDPKTDIDLLVRTVNKTKKPTNKISKVTKKAPRKGYNPEDPASRVFHLTKKDFDAADVVGKGTSDIGFHVGTAAQASGRGSTGLGYDRELMEKMVEGERILPLVLKYNLKPARIPDMSSFKSPQNWIGNLSVAKSDRSRIKFLLGEQADADLLAKAPRVTVGGDTYYMLPDVMREGMDPELWKDLILEASRAKRIGLDTISKQEDRITWFSTLKHTANKHGYDSFVYKNEYEGVSRDTVPTWQEELNTPSLSNDSYMLLEADQAKGLFGEMTEGSPEFMKNKGGLMLQKGGAIPMNNMAQQMELFEPVKTGFDSGGLTKSTSSDQLLIDFNAIAEDYNESRNISGSQRAITGQEMMSIFDALTGNKIKLTPVNMQEGGLLDEGGTKDPVSGNDVPPGSMQEEVRDDIPAQLSEGEFVFPADVVRFIGLEKLMKIRQRAKAGLQRMEDMGQMGNSEEAIMPDDLPFSIDDLDMEDDGLEMNVGGFVTPLPGPNFNMNPQVPGPMGMNPNIGMAPSPAGVDPNLRGTVFTPTTIQPTFPTYEEAVGPGVVNVDYENVTFRHEDGREIILKRDKRTGKIIDPIPDGFSAVDASKAAVGTTKTQTTQTRQDDGDGGAGDEGVGTTTKDVTGIGYDRSKLDPKVRDLVTAYGAGFGTLADTFFKGPRQALMEVPGSIASSLGRPDLFQNFGKPTALSNSLTSAAFGGVLDNFRGYTGQGNLFSKETTAGGIMNTSVYTNNVPLDQLGSVAVDRLDTTARAVVEELRDLFVDDKGNAISAPEARQNIVNEAKRNGIRTTIRGTNLARKATAIIRELAAKKSRDFESKAQTEAAQQKAEAEAKLGSMFQDYSDYVDSYDDSGDGYDTSGGEEEGAETGSSPAGDPSGPSGTQSEVDDFESDLG